MFVDIITDRVYELTFAEFDIPPKYETGNCEIFDRLHVSKKEINLKPGEKLEVSVKGDYMDVSSQKSTTKKLTFFDRLKLKSSDKNTVQVSKKDDKIIIKAPSYPAAETASVVLEYKEKGEIFGKDYLFQN